MSEEVKIPILVVKSSEGKIEETNVIEGKSIEEILREYVKRAADEWNPQLSDFTVMKTFYELRYKLPIDPDLYDLAVELNLDLEREGNEVIVKLPVYTISFDNRWSGDSYRDLRVYVITYLVDEKLRDQIIEYAKETTSREKKLESETSLDITPEQLQRLEEGLAEAEAAEQVEPSSGRKKRRRRSRKSN